LRSGIVIKLTDQMKDKLSSARADGTTVMAASIEPDGYPKFSYYGSLHVFTIDQLALWHRTPDSGLVARIAAHPKMSFLYRHPSEPIFWQFSGRARVVDDEDVRGKVYEGMPEGEKLFDPDRRGKAVIIDVDRVVGSDGEQRRDESSS
jgi:general stress protein 26